MHREGLQEPALLALHRKVGQGSDQADPDVRGCSELSRHSHRVKWPKHLCCTRSTQALQQDHLGVFLLLLPVFQQYAPGPAATCFCLRMIVQLCDQCASSKMQANLVCSQIICVEYDLLSVQQLTPKVDTDCISLHLQALADQVQQQTQSKMATEQRTDLCAWTGCALFWLISCKVTLLGTYSSHGLRMCHTSTKQLTIVECQPLRDMTP